VVVMAFMLFHVSQPEAALDEVRRVLGPDGAVGLTTWGRGATVAALEVWNDELDRHGAPPASPFRISSHDTPPSVRRAGAWPPWNPPPGPLFCAVYGLDLTS
jgi:ubiquinone/menaquinone biosynthesis C-methylase UbiE